MLWGDHYLRLNLEVSLIVWTNNCEDESQELHLEKELGLRIFDGFNFGTLSREPVPNCFLDQVCLIAQLMNLQIN